MVLILRLIGKQPQNTTALTLTWNTRDGLYWSVLGTIESSVMSTELKDYFFIHENTPLDMNYYRLLQVDIDGTQKQYHPIAISCSENNWKTYRFTPIQTPDLFK